jgi:hypothetical protein
MSQDERAKALQKFVDGVVKQARTNLTKRKKNASKKLYNSIKGESKVYPNSIRIGFEMEDYGFFQDQGVNGKKKNQGSRFSFRDKMPPPSALDKWIVRRGIAPRDAKGKLLPRKTLQFIIARSIYNKGIKPSKFFSDAIETSLKKLPTELINPYVLTVSNIIDIAIKENVRKNAVFSSSK